MKSFKFLSFNPSAKEDRQNPANNNKNLFRRREQVRKAQRTYRERKEDYIKSLEEEVVQLRANEANIANETRKLYSENAALRNLLLQHGIEPPPHVEISDTSQSLADPDDAVTVSIAKDRGKHPQIQVRPTVSHATTQDRVRSSSGAECGLSPELQGIGLMHQGECTSPETCLANRSISVPRAPGSSERVAELDQTMVGTEFVLTLEAPCLGHIHGEPQDPPNAPTGHALTTTAPLLHLAPTGTVTGTGPSTSPPHASSSWEAPTTILERLLDLSGDLILEDEVSPVQAWNYIRSHPDFYGLEMERMRVLTAKLLKHVKCHGFGAVVDKGVFEDALFEAFVVGRVFEPPFLGGN